MTEIATIQTNKNNEFLEPVLEIVNENGFNKKKLVYNPQDEVHLNQSTKSLNPKKRKRKRKT
jgi:hypothetical protein